MEVKDIVTSLELNVFGGEQGLGKIVKGGYTSDLLSDVMGHAGEGQVWITLQTHRNVLAIASLKDIAAVILVNNAVPDADMLEQAIQEGIPVLGTSESSFAISGKLFNLLTK